MKLFGTVAGALLVLLGLVWVLQGSNVLAGSAMSGQSQWLYIGIIVVLTGIATVVVSRRKRRL